MCSLLVCVTLRFNPIDWFSEGASSFFTAAPSLTSSRTVRYDHLVDLLADFRSLTVGVQAGCDLLRIGPPVYLLATTSASVGSGVTSVVTITVPVSVGISVGTSSSRCV